MYDLLVDYSNQTKKQICVMTPNFIRAIWDVEFRQVNQEAIPEDLWFKSPEYYLDQDTEPVSLNLDQIRIEYR